MNPHFASLVMGLAQQAHDALEGRLPPGLPDAGVDPREIGKTLIDTLGMLEEKTRGRLDEDESRLLTELLTSLRFRFVQQATP